MKIHLGISTCPNDTFAFAALLEGRSDTFGLDFEVELLDVEELNLRLAAGDFDVAKASFAAAQAMSDQLGVLPSGSAIGFGNGPLLLSPHRGRAPGPGDRVLCPGANTTADLLLRTFYPDAGPAEQVVFSEIMPALEEGRADFGVCIHEGRFTYQERGLTKVCDFGERWQAERDAPLPLGGILARKSLGVAALRQIQRAVSASLEVALADPSSAKACMRKYAQEFDDAVLQAHVDLYVNDRTRDLGPEGRAALEELAQCAGTAPLEVVGMPRLFHLAFSEPWQAWSEGAWAPPSFATEGFLHLSFAEQLQGTLDTHFAHRPALILAEVDAARIGAHLRLEPSRGGALFPHLYAPLAREAVLRTWELGPLPDLGED